MVKKTGVVGVGGQEFKSCVNREVGLGSHSLSHSSPSLILISHTFFFCVDAVKHHERGRWGGGEDTGTEGVKE